MSKWEDKYLKEPVDGWQFPPDFLREMAHAINDESNESIEMEELEAVLLHLLKLDSSHPEQGEQGELYRWQEIKTDKDLPTESGAYFVKIDKWNAGARLIFSKELGWMYDEKSQVMQSDKPSHWLCKLSSPPPEGQDDPVAFVKWIGCKFFYDDESELWETIPEGKTYDFNGQKQFRFTSDELYKLFKMQKDFIGDPDECTGAFEGQ